MKLWRRSIVPLLVVGVGVVAAPVAVAAPPEPSAVQVSATTLAQGETFTVTQEIYNPADFTVSDVNASIAGLGDVVDLVSCTGALAPCTPYFTSFRGYLGNLDPDEERNVVFTFRVKDNANPGVVEWSNQLVGSDYAFEAAASPALTITGTPQAADLRVSLSATPRGLLAPRVDYAVTVTNLGPGAAEDIRAVATYAAGLGWGGSGDCARVGSTRNVNCDVDSLGVGESATMRFSTTTGLLALGPFTTSVQRSASSPADPNAGNDRAARTCTAVTGLIILC